MKLFGYANILRYFLIRSKCID